MDQEQTPLDKIDLGALEAFLESDRAPPDTMNLSELDGFLHGVAVGPELVLPSEWLPIVWGGETSNLAAIDEARIVLGSIMGRYNEILKQIENGQCRPIFWTDSDDTLIPFDWTHGFMEAMGLRVNAWGALLNSERDRELILPILALCTDEDGESLVDVDPGDSDKFIAEAAGLVPHSVLGISAYWQGKSPPIPWGTTTRAGPKVGRNEPCPCGSGKKFKKCCGKSG